VVTIENVRKCPNTYNHKKRLFRACKFARGPDPIKNLGLLGLLKAHEGQLRTSNQCFSVCLYSPSCYLLIPSYLRLKPLKF
jgi:hypothetical protein